MNRRHFLCAAAAGSASAKDEDLPKYRTVSRYQPLAQPGMPGRYPGRVITAHSERAIDTATEKVDASVVREMIARGMTALTGATDARDAWAGFFVPADVVGIKVNCSGAPNIMSTPAVVAEIVGNLIAVGVKPAQIWIYERFLGQLESVHYERWVPEGVHIDAVEKSRRSIREYDPATYVEVDFFGEDDTRSNLVRHVSERFTKIINVPNMKDHGASGVTGCLKNIAYGNFSNVARSHHSSKTNTLSFIGTLASTEPLRSRTVLQVMDGLRGVWHGGPFSPNPKFRFYPKMIRLGTDPVAIDRLLIDVIEDKRKAEKVVSVWDRSPSIIRPRGSRDDPNHNVYIREPGHIEFATRLGLGEYDIRKIRETRIEL